MQHIKKEHHQGALTKGPTMYYNRFDIAEAYYIHLQETHTGQGSKEYARLSKLAQKFKPAMKTSNGALLSSENAMEIYLKLQDKYNAKR